MRAEEQRRSAAATPCHGKTREVGEADKSPGFLLLGDESSISGGGGGLVVKAGSDAGELPERCRAPINHRRVQQRKHRGGMKSEAEQEEQAAVAEEQEGIWG